MAGWFSQVLLLVLLVVGAQPDALAQDRVVEVHVLVEGDGFLGLVQEQAEEALLGRPFDEERARTLLQRLHRTGNYRSLEMTHSRSPDDPAGLIVTVTIETSPMVRDLRVIGLQRLTEEEFSRLASGIVGRPLDHFMLERLCWQIMDALRWQGYMHASARFANEIDSEGVIEIVVEEGSQSLLSDVSIMGLPDANLARVLEKVLDDHDLVVGAPYRSEQAERVEAAVTRALWAEGYIDARVAYSLELEDLNKVSLTLLVDHGPQYRIREVILVGDAVEKRESLLASFEQHRSLVNTADNTDRIRTEVRGAHLAEGYAHVEVDTYTLRVPEEAQVDVRVTVTPGPRVRVGRISITGNRHASFEDILSYNEAIIPGQYADWRRVIELERELNGLPWCDSATISFQPMLESALSESCNIVMSIEDRPYLIDTISEFWNGDESSAVMYLDLDAMKSLAGYPHIIPLQASALRAEDNNGGLDAIKPSESSLTALLERGDRDLMAGDWLQSLYAYEAICRQADRSNEYFVAAVTRELLIGAAVRARTDPAASGFDAHSEEFWTVQELLLRVAERLPGTRQAEQALLELVRLHRMAGDTRAALEVVGLCKQNLPSSEARKELDQAHLDLLEERYPGVGYDYSPLIDARGVCLQMHRARIDGSQAACQSFDRDLKIAFVAEQMAVLGSLGFLSDAERRVSELVVLADLQQRIPELVGSRYLSQIMAGHDALTIDGAKLTDELQQVLRRSDD